MISTIEPEKANSEKGKPIKRGHLAKPLSKYERYMIGRLYKENIGLVREFAKRLQQKYQNTAAADINSCVDLAFIKAARQWNPEKGRLSTIFHHYAVGEVNHFLRSNSNWGYSVPRGTRELGAKARSLIVNRQVPVCLIPTILGCTKEELKDALLATLRVRNFYGGKYSDQDEFTYFESNEQILIQDNIAEVDIEILNLRIYLFMIFLWKRILARMIRAAKKAIADGQTIDETI
jgi:DNA-directed RNA polymerase specialized sigma subunit